MPFRNKRCSHVRFSFFSIGTRGQCFRPRAGGREPALLQGGVLLKGRSTPTRMSTDYSGYLLAYWDYCQISHQTVGIDLHGDTTCPTAR